jgi:O-antigen/teichoic acid export membrane protein
MALTCLYEIARGLLGLRVSPQGVADLLDSEAEPPAEARSQLLPLFGGIGLLAAYALVVNVLGFLLSTFFFLAAFMYVGRYRNHVAIWSIAVGMTVVIAFLFLRFAYVSLPRGVPPFDGFTDLLRVMLGG